MKTFELVLQEDNKITLDQKMIKELELDVGDSLTVSYNKSALGDACFTVEPGAVDESDEEYYCIPMRILRQVGLDVEIAHLIINDEEMTLTSTMNVVGSFPPELIEAMVEQGVDLNILVEDMVERLNKNVLEKIEE